jgi:fluoroquinolone transport system ATP-binding protein
MIEAAKLYFSYEKNKEFIRDMSFIVDKGEVFGFLGPSGAGKSTVQKILSGILRNYRGSVRVLQTDIKNRSNSFYENIGVVFEFPNLYGKFTALENLMFFSSLYERKSYDPMALLERVGLSEDAHKKVASYSKGMKMRLAFVRAILHKPSLLFLDEPTSGLDPTYARIIKELILEQKKEGRTIILTTHNMHDAEELCDRVAFIVDGQIRALDTPHALRTRKSGVEVSYTYWDGEKEKTASAQLSTLHFDADFMKRLNAGLLTGIHSKEPTLEDIFIELTGRCLK